MSSTDLEIDPVFDVAGLAATAVAAGERSAEIERLRRLPADLVGQLIDTGVFKLWVPRAFGGSEAHVLDAADAIESVAYRDASTGWCIMIGITTGLLGGYLSGDHAEAVFGRRDAIGGGFAFPTGTAVAVEGGLRVRGRWSWGSGTDHCTSIGGGVRVVDADGQPAALANGARTMFAFFDRDDVEILDTWHVAGLKGTASNDYVVSDAFVPEGRWAELSPTREPAADNPLYRFAFRGALSVGVASVLIGLGRRAIDELVALGAKVSTGSTRSIGEHPAVQAQIADADAAVRSSRAFLREAVDECWAAAAEGSPVTDEHRRLLRMAATNTAVRCAHAVDVCYSAGGGSSIFESSPLQRVFRDAHVASQHGMVAPRTFETHGRMLFGLPTDTIQL